MLRRALCLEYDTGTLLKGADVPEARALIRELDALTSDQASQPTLEDAVQAPARLFEPFDPIPARPVPGRSRQFPHRPIRSTDAA